MGFIRYIKNQIRHDRNVKQMLIEQRGEIKELRSLLEKLRLDMLTEKTLHSTKMGISEERLCEHEVVVSLTSFGKRIFDVYLAIESIMQGSVKPNRIVLWLAEDEFGEKKLPQTLLLQQPRGLEVRYCEDIRSYKKLIPSLKMFPNACIVTIDDDAVYEFDVLERLVNTHVENPDAICACRLHRIKLNEDHSPDSYINWEWCVENCTIDSTLLFPTTGGGTLFPPNCFTKEVFNQKVFMEICPLADDIWFYSMRLLSEAPVVQVATGNPNGYYMDLQSGDIDSLGNQNFRSVKCLNDVQMKAVFDKYQLYNKLINSIE